MKHIYLLLFSLLAFTSAQSLSVTITADKTVACPGGSVNLSATVTELRNQIHFWFMNGVIRAMVLCQTAIMILPSLLCPIREM
ncbi:MAG: hypothetical protein IPP77_03100 [Bacteroidetes bacterium]|nr:hypothetical protein [Bacteroidota bacterium]